MPAVTIRSHPCACVGERTLCMLHKSSCQSTEAVVPLAIGFASADRQGGNYSTVWKKATLYVAFPGRSNQPRERGCKVGVPPAFPSWNRAPAFTGCCRVSSGIREMCGTPPGRVKVPWGMLWEVWILAVAIGFPQQAPVCTPCDEGRDSVTLIRPSETDRDN